jgi:hypothetical protein
MYFVRRFLPSTHLFELLQLTIRHTQLPRQAGHVELLDSSGSSDFSSLSCRERQEELTFSVRYRRYLQLYFQWKNGSFSSVDTTGGGLIYYRASSLFSSFPLLPLTLMHFLPSSRLPTLIDPPLIHPLAPLVSTSHSTSSLPLPPVPRNHSTDTTKVMAFPDGLRMLTGNPFLRSYNSSSLTAQAIGFNCLGSAGGANGDTRQPYLPPYNCPSGMRGEIRFPSCWNGKDLDSSVSGFALLLSSSCDYTCRSFLTFLFLPVRSAHFPLPLFLSFPLAGPLLAHGLPHRRRVRALPLNP